MAFDQPFSRDGAGRFTGQGAHDYTGSVSVQEYTPLGEADLVLRTGLEDADTRLRDFGPDAGLKAAVVRASPGAGKSVLARKLLAHTQEERQGSVAFHVPTIALAVEAEAHANELGLSAVTIRGRSSPRPDGEGRMCARHDLAERASRIGLSVQHHLCVQESKAGQTVECPHRATCGYLAQFDVEADVRFLATAYLRHPDGQSETTSLRIIDEKFYGEYISIRDVPITSLTEPRTHFPSDQAARHADLLKASKLVVSAMLTGRSPLELGFDAEEYKDFAQAERLGVSPTPGIRPDQSERRQRELLEKAERDYREVHIRSAIWTILADAKAAGLSSPERLRLHSRDNMHLLRVARKHAQKHKQPTLILDADADEKILEALGIDVISDVDVSLRPNAYICQVHDRRMSSSSLLKSRRLRDDWRRVIVEEVLTDRLGKSSGVLVGATRKVVRAMFEDAGHSFQGMLEEDISSFMLETKLHGAHWLWFGGRALGSNRYKECSAVIVIGREELPIDALEDQARALWGDTPGEPLLFVERDENGQRALPLQEVPYEMAGAPKAAMVPTHPDPRVECLQRQTREFATRQIVERLRLARSPYRKRVILGCKIPIPGMPVDELLTWEELRPSRARAAITAGLLYTGGTLLDVHGLHSADKGTFPSAEAAKKHLKRDHRSSCDLRSPMSSRPKDRVQLVRLQQDRPHARGKVALLRAATAGEAEDLARELFGPLKSCEAV